MTEKKEQGVLFSEFRTNVLKGEIIPSNMNGIDIRDYKRALINIGSGVVKCSDCKINCEGMRVVNVADRDPSRTILEIECINENLVYDMGLLAREDRHDK